MKANRDSTDDPGVARGVVNGMATACFIWGLGIALLVLCVMAFYAFG